VALGHLHRYQNLNPQGYPALVYSGSIERVDFGERKEDKGFCLVELAKNVTTHQFIKSPMRPFIQIEVVLDVKDNQTQRILDAIAEHDIADAVVKILYHLPEEKKDSVDLPAIQRACATAMYLVGVIPIRKPCMREKRLAMKIDMDLSTLLTTYFNARPDSQEKKDELVNKTLLLLEELQEAEQQ
jgi:exonuclease SbcD